MSDKKQIYVKGGKKIATSVLTFEGLKKQLVVCLNLIHARALLSIQFFLPLLWRHFHVNIYSIFHRNSLSSRKNPMTTPAPRENCGTRLPPNVAHPTGMIFYTLSKSMIHKVISTTHRHLVLRGTSCTW